MAGLVSAIEMAIVKHRRKVLSKQLFARYQGVVQNGVFKGMRFAGHPNVSKASYGLKILGLYEPDVLNQLRDWAPVDALIDMGAGDGYFPIGMLRAGLVRRAICFEATPSGRAEILRNAELNGVAHQITIFGKVDTGIADQLRKLDIKNDDTLILCDIEGGEFEIFKRSLIEYLNGARFIIELHDRLGPDDDGALRRVLLAEFPEQYHVSIIKDSPRDWSDIRDLEAMHDLDRALVASEGRKIMGEWLVAETA